MAKSGASCHRLGKVGQGPVNLALFQIDHPTHIKSINIFGLEFQGRVEVGQGWLILAFLRISDAAIVKGVNRIGVYFYRLAEVGDGEVPLISEGHRLCRDRKKRTIVWGFCTALGNSEMAWS